MRPIKITTTSDQLARLVAQAAFIALKNARLGPRNTIDRFRLDLREALHPSPEEIAQGHLTPIQVKAICSHRHTFRKLLDLT